MQATRDGKLRCDFAFSDYILLLCYIKIVRSRILDSAQQWL